MATGAPSDVIVFYELAIGIGGLITSAFFLYILNQNIEWDLRRMAFKFTAALTFFSVEMLTQIIEQTWDMIYFAGMTFPSLQVMFEAVILGFLVSGMWDIWNMNLEQGG